MTKTVATFTYAVRFHTPAFLGDAEQSGRWRTPPFKALIRQWWRVAYAADRGFCVDVDEMRRAEGAVFGAAADKSGNRSRVRIRLDRWTPGGMTQWQGDPGVFHKEVGKEIGAHLYLGFGPLTNKGQETFLGRKVDGSLKPHAAIQAGERAELRLAFPEADPTLLVRALHLIDRYGALGGRSRNGWGSLSLSPVDGEEDGKSDHPLPLRPWREALSLDWPHAIGKDGRGPLIWQTDPFDDWTALMHRLAEIKIGFRTQFAFPNSKPPHHDIEDRHWLAYPVTRHATRVWKRDARLPNSLRFKVRPDGAPTKLRGVIYHVPCRPPEGFTPDSPAIEDVWQRVHAFLDEPAQNLKRIPE